MSDTVFLFIYEFLKMGGIEKSIINLIRTYSKMEIKIIWLR